MTSKGDVYRYGMMVLEMVDLKKDFNALENTNEIYLRIEFMIVST